MPVLGPRVGPATVLPAIGMYLLVAVPFATGQDVNSPTISLGRFRLSAVSQTSEACGSKLTAPAVQQNLEGQLHASGIDLSSIYNAQISTDLDCTALDAGVHPASMA